MAIYSFIAFMASLPPLQFEQHMLNVFERILFELIESVLNVWNPCGASWTLNERMVWCTKHSLPKREGSYKKTILQYLENSKYGFEGKNSGIFFFSEI